jgi:hypothetical protein
VPRRVRAALAVEETHDFYSRALELAGSDDDRRRIRFRRGVALAQLAEYARADKEIVATLNPERAERYLSAPQVAEVLEAAT